MITIPDSFQIYESLSLTDFTLGMLALGNPIEVSLVGSFESEGRGSRRDMDMPFHKDGGYSAKGRKDFPYPDIVGLYCLRTDPEHKCITGINHNGDLYGLELQEGQALVFNNNNILHSREGKVGNRVLFRIWIKL